MAFVVEDGSIVEDANALVDVEFVDDYFADRGVAAWTGTSTVKEQAIVRATDYTEQRWSSRYIGSIVDDDQVLSWPRTEVVDKQGRALASDAIPLKVKQAVAEYALRALTNQLFVEPSVDPTGLQLAGTRQKVGPIETETRYAVQGPKTLRPWPAADRLLSEFVTSSNEVIRA